jgi:hypothetical protein
MNDELHGEKRKMEEQTLNRHGVQLYDMNKHYQGVSEWIRWALSAEMTVKQPKLTGTHTNR